MGKNNFANSSSLFMQFSVFTDRSASLAVLHPPSRVLKRGKLVVSRFLKNHRVALQIQHIGRLYRSDVLDKVHIKKSALSVCQKCYEILYIVLCHKMTKLF